MERDLWILMHSVSPNEAAIWLADKRAAIADPEFCAIYLAYDAAFDWSPDDQRLYTLADRAQRWLANWHGSSDGAAKPVLDPGIAQLAMTPVGVSSPAWDRLIQIAKQAETTDLGSS
jgi:hypothetical protein